MYICDRCHKVSNLYEKQNTLVTAIRDKYYYNVIILNQITKEKEYKSYGEKNIKILDDLKLAGFKVLKDYMSRGSEIISEQKICGECNDRLNILKGSLR